MSRTSYPARLGLLVAVALTACSAVSVQAQDRIWNGSADTNFFNDANWDGGAPDTLLEYGVIDDTDAGHVAIIDAATGTVELDGVNIGELNGGGNVIQNGGTLNFDAFSTTKIGGDGPNPSTWIMNNDAVLNYDSPLNGGGSGYGSDGQDGSDFDVGNGASEATFELHDNAILRIADDMKISDNGTAVGGHVLLDGNAQVLVGSGTSVGPNGPATVTVAENALYVSGNSAGPGNTAEGYTNEGYLAFSEGSVLVKDSGRFWIRTLQARDEETSITVEDNGRFDIFEVFFNASPVLGTTTVGSTTGASVNGNERTSETAEGVGSKTTITVRDSGFFTVDSDLSGAGGSAWSGLALSGGNNRGGNNGGGETMVDISGQGTFIIQHDLNMTLGFDIDAKSTLKVRGPDATVQVNGDLRMALDEFDAENPGSAAIHAVLTGSSHTTIEVGGDINIDNGDLIVELDDFAPSGGESYELISAGSVTGSAFENEDFSLATLGAGLSWDVSVSGNSVFLNVLGGGPNADLNNDGFVDGLDLGILLGNFEQNATPGGGELNGTDPVDGLDLGILLGAWDPPEGLAAASVPEPASLLLFGLAALLCPRSRRQC